MEPTVDFITFCCPKDVTRLHEPGVLDAIIDSHEFPFDNTWLVYQRLGILWDVLPSHVKPVEININLTNGLLYKFGINPDNPKAEEMTHGPNASHYWKWHVINHIAGLFVSEADYVVFSDCDCNMVSQPGKSWVAQGISILQRNPDVLIVSPSDGAGERKTQNVSQQLFLCERARLASIDFDIPWDWEFLAPGEPMQEYYYMLEGRIWRYMHHNGLYRYVLPDKWRYWHNQW